MSLVVRHARYRAPDESGQKLFAPPWEELPSLLGHNLAWRRRADVAVAGQSLGGFSAAARREFLSAAQNYVSGYAAGDFGALNSDRPLILTGHQPGLSHPGVWLKNFAAATLAEQSGGIAGHLVIDADACRSAAVRVPSGTVDQPLLATVELDRQASEMPWEERAVLDMATWRRFPERVHAASASLLPAMFLDEWWSRAIERATATGNVGASLAQARHLAEINWGRRNLELPQSQICQMVAFRRFAAHLLAHLSDFVDAHNGALANYRHAHRLRNHVHPAPNLTSDGPWLEAPFWLWSVADPRRRPAFVRLSGGATVLSDRSSFEKPLPLADVNATVEQLDRWERGGWKLRSRALVTTMFVRLALADLFIHGIGGAKYDEATDEICEKFFGFAPPAYSATSGTLRLPIEHPAGGPEDVRQLRDRLRRLTFHPETFVRATSAASPQIERKAQAIAAGTTRGGASERHRAIAAANRGLAALVDDQRQQTAFELEGAVARARANRILDWREYAFCLFPRELLEQFLLDFRR